MRKLLFAMLVLASCLVCGLAFAQHKPQKVHPVPVPTASASASAAHEEGAKEAAEKEEEEAGPSPMNWWDTKIFNNAHASYGATLINFSLLLLIYYRLGRQPLANALKNRKVSIASAIENAQKMLSEAKHRSKRYRAQLEKVEGSAEAVKQNEKAIGEGRAKEILVVANEKAERLKRDVDFILDQEKKQTQLDLVRETVEKAAKEAEELLKKNVSTADQERLAEEFITKLAADYAKGLPLGGGAS